MNKVMLIAGNHLRDQRWVLATMFAYAILMSAVFGFFAGRPSPEDAHFFIEQQLWFAVLFSVFLATAAVNTDMRTRRILAILSKAVHRWQYLLGVITGIAVAMFAYCAMVGISGGLVSAKAGQPYEGLWIAALQIGVAAVTVACVGLFFGVILSPLFATAATFAYLTLIPFLALRISPELIALSPVTFLLGQSSSGFRIAPTLPLPALIISALLQAIAFFALAMFVFSRRDVARPTE